MSATRPLISIGMPVRNNCKTLEVTVRSILAQTYTDWELLLIDDGSTDETPGIALSLAAADERIKVIVDGRPLGLPERLNQSIDLARGDLFARMDGDDVAYPRRLERQVAYLEEHPEIDLVGAWAMVFHGDGQALGKRAGAERHEEICARSEGGFPLIHPTYMGRIAFFRRYGYSTGAIRCEDQDLLLRAFQASSGPRMAKSQDQDLLVRAYRESRFANVPEILLGYREEQLNLRKIAVSRSYFLRSVLHESWKQRRPVMAAKAVVGQAVKVAVDAVAIGTGLGYRLLKHRARPVSADEVAEWRDVWGALQEGRRESASSRLALVAS